MNYNNPTQLQAAILDWAGTVVDFGSFAPTQIFVEAFAEFGVQVSLEEARGPMGMGKWDHIRPLCDVPAIAARLAWTKRKRFRRWSCTLGAQNLVAGQQGAPRQARGWLE